MGILSDILNDAPSVKPLGNVSHMEKCLASDSMITMDAEQWITIHPNGEGDNRHIQIDDQTGEILKGGAVALQGTNIRDFGKNAREKRLEIEGKKFKTEEEYQEKEKRLKQDLDEINRLAESDKYEDLNKAVKKLIDNGFYGTRNFDMRGRLQQSIKEKRPETYKDILDTKAHHKDVQAFKDAEQKITEKIRKKHLEAQKVLGKMYDVKKTGRYNVIAKMYEENSETLKFLADSEKEKLKSIKEWTKSKIYRK